MKQGTLVISLDFELVWGIFDHVQLLDKKTYFNNTLSAIPKMVSMFEENDIAVTWATVGMLFNESWEEWEANVPSVLPTYANKKLDAYSFGKQHQKSGFDSYFFAPHLIRMIQSTKKQEVATHTYSHYYCLEKGQTIDQFEADINQASKIAQKFSVALKSLVFPRNQFNKEYLEVCSKNKIETVRTNPNSWYWDTTKPETFLSKLNRTADAYFPLGKKSYSLSDIETQEIFCQPASRFLRPQHTSGILNGLRLNRIKNEMIQAAKNGEVYHLWWHPHNFGMHTEDSLKTLQAIIDVFSFCRKEFGMKSETMKQLRDSSVYAS